MSYNKNDYEKSMKSFLKIICFLFVLVMIVNVFVGPSSDMTLILKLLQFAMIVSWVIALLSSLGYVKKVAMHNADTGVTQYTTIVPTVPVTLIRIVEFLYLYIFRDGFADWKRFILCVGLDLVFVVLLLIDKSNYYYESVEIRKE